MVSGIGYGSVRGHIGIDTAQRNAAGLRCYCIQTNPGIVYPMRFSRLAPAALFLTALAAPSQAQGSGSGYLFGAPDVRLSFHAGYAHANAKSEVFDFVIQNLTLNRGSFSGPNIGGDLSIRVAPRLDLSIGVDYSAAVKNSDDRVFIDNNNLPIEQTTSFRRAPLMANALVYLAPRGRSVGTLAWIPARVVPWIGAGAGTMWYRFQQQGDFVDYQTLNVFNATLQSSGWTPAFQGLGGVDVTLSPRVGFTADARYLWAKADLSNDFRNFDRIDLSGITGSLGFAIRL
jgi:hypothetical protein